MTGRSCTIGAWLAWALAWRSTWEVEGDIAAGRLLSVLDTFAAPPNGIYALFPQAKHLPLRVRLWVDFLKLRYADPGFWRAAGPGAAGLKSHPAGSAAASQLASGRQSAIPTGKAAAGMGLAMP